MNNDEEIDLEHLANNLEPGDSIVVLHKIEEYIYELMVGTKEGFVSWQFNKKAYTSLKNMLEVYQEKAVLVEDINIDGVMIENYNSGFLLTLNNITNYITIAEVNAIAEIIKQNNDTSN